MPVGEEKVRQRRHIENDGVAKHAAGAPEVDDKPVKPRRPRWTTGIVGVLLTWVAFSNAVKGAEYIQDDQLAIDKNADVDGTTTWGEVFTHDFWGTPLRAEGSHKSYRPIAIAWMRLLAATFGKHPEVFKLGNIAWHSLCVFLVHELCRRVFFREDAWKCCWAMLLFALHPVHAESVDGLVGVADLMAMAFAIVSTMLYRSSSVAVCTCLVLSFLSKEIGLTVAVPIVYMLATDPDGALSIRRRTTIAGCVVATVVGLLLVRQYLTGGDPFVRNYRRMDNMLAFVEDPATFYLTMANVWWTYLGMLLYPAYLSSEYSYNAVPEVPPTAANIVFFGVFIAVSAFTALGLLLVHRGFIPGFCVVFFLASFFPASHLAYRPGVYIAERLMYTPSLAVCVFFAWLMAVRGKLRYVWHVFFLLVCLAFTCVLWERNDAWLTALKLWSRAVEVRPGSARAHLAVGINLVNLQQPRDMADKGFTHLDLAANIAPEFCQPDYWRGRYHIEHTRNYTEAAHYMWKAVDCYELQHNKFAIEALLTMYGAFVKHEPEKMDNYLQLVKVYAKLERWEDVESIVVQAKSVASAKKFKISLDIRYYYGMALLKNVQRRSAQRTEAAVAATKRLLLAKPGTPHAAMGDEVRAYLQQMGVRLVIDEA